MYWSWTGGYKHVKIEVTRTIPGAAAAATYNFHLGSTGCALAVPTDPASSVCTKLNTPAFDFPAFNPATQAVALDIAGLFVATDFDLADGGGAPGCMSGETDPECAPVFPKLGLPVNGIAAEAQSVFRLVTK
jgi:uncharacterized repeat protein (TIGR04052 family)